jgi:hypothetical protein
VQNGVFGQWVNAVIVVSGDAPAFPAARWKQTSAKQLSQAAMAGTSVTDSGITVSGRPPFHIVARSLGYRGDYTRDYYSYLQINEQIMLGFWWVIGNSFMVMRADERTGAHEFRAFSVAADTNKANEMAAYLTSVREGETVALTVVYDGYTNVSPALRQAIRALGSTMIDFVLPGHSWMMIGRIGRAPPASPGALESRWRCG